MKRKYLLSAIAIAFIANIAFVGSPNATDVFEYSCDEIVSRHSSKDIVGKIPTFTGSEIGRFDSGIAKTTGFDTAKSNDKPVKYKFFDKENLRIEQSVENYILYSHTLAYHYPDLDKLQRLNV